MVSIELLMIETRITVWHYYMSMYFYLPINHSYHICTPPNSGFDPISHCPLLTPFLILD